MKTFRLLAALVIIAIVVGWLTVHAVQSMP